jgi:hypothetical protein
MINTYNISYPIEKGTRWLGLEKNEDNALTHSN